MCFNNYKKKLLIVVNKFKIKDIIKADIKIILHLTCLNCFFSENFLTSICVTILKNPIHLLYTKHLYWALQINHSKSNYYQCSRRYTMYNAPVVFSLTHSQLEFILYVTMSAENICKNVFYYQYVIMLLLMNISHTPINNLLIISFK